MRVANHIMCWGIPITVDAIAISYGVLGYDKCIQVVHRDKYYLSTSGSR